MAVVKGLVVTEKSGPCESQRDGGARLLETLRMTFGDSLSVMQFGPEADSSSTWHINYPFQHENRFERRLANGNFIAEKIKEVEEHFTHIIFIHISMQFGLIDIPLRKGVEVWTFPMFLTPSYRTSGEEIPQRYIEKERQALATSQNVITPSHFEKQQIIDHYCIPFHHIHVIPRGVSTHMLFPATRSFQGALRLCSVGSIKPQKNILGLVRLFSKIHVQYPGATLQVIGPVQNPAYYKLVRDEVQRLNLETSVEFEGYISPSKLSEVTGNAHLHLSTSTCETFGRSIFETLALGLPNIARLHGNAAADFLQNLPYIQFADDDEKALQCIEKMLFDLPTLSTMSQEIGSLYNDQLLSRLLHAKICRHCSMGISDFDGTLYHKGDDERTLQSIEAFRRFPTKVICSARPISQLLELLETYHLEVDWIIGYSGGAVSDGNGNLLWTIPLKEKQIHFLEKIISQTAQISFKGEVLQIATPTGPLPDPMIGFRSESYQETTFIGPWEASKLRAVLKLLHSIKWSGQVAAFGDGPYDEEFLTYFDGVFIPSNFTQKKESIYV